MTGKKSTRKFVVYLQKKYTGGTVLHLYLGERIPDAESCKRLVRKSLSQFRLPYITVTPTFSVCPKHGYIAGEHQFCPVCDDIQTEKVLAEAQANDEKLSPSDVKLTDEQRQNCEVWTRVMGYFRPVSQFNAGKKSEYGERMLLRSEQVVRSIA